MTEVHSPTDDEPSVSDAAVSRRTFLQATGLAAGTVPLAVSAGHAAAADGETWVQLSGTSDTNVVVGTDTDTDA